MQLYPVGKDWNDDLRKEFSTIVLKYGKNNTEKSELLTAITSGYWSPILEQTMYDIALRWKGEESLSMLASLDGKIMYYIRCLNKDLKTELLSDDKPIAEYGC
jgi:hypothetical protein